MKRYLKLEGNGIDLDRYESNANSTTFQIKYLITIHITFIAEKYEKRL